MSALAETESQTSIMTPITQSVPAAIAGIALSLFPFATSAAAQCSNYASSPAGTLLLDADDAIYEVGLPFAFPFDGESYTSITVSTNGWIKFGDLAFGSSQTGESEALMLADGPRIALLWDDLNPGNTGAGDVYFAATGTQATITFQGVQGYNNPTALANCECVLTSAGDIFLNYDPSGTYDQGNSCMVGISRGDNSGSPGTYTVDWSNADGGTVPVVDATAYEVFDNQEFDLTGGWVLHFQPTGVDSYAVTKVPALPTCAPGNYPQLASVTSFGYSCTATGPGSHYEKFTSANGADPVDLANTGMRFMRAGQSYTQSTIASTFDTYAGHTQLTLGDDEIVTLPVGAMQSFTLGGFTTTTLDICSNGFIGLTPGPWGSIVSSTPGAFHQQGPRIAPLWMDLNPADGGEVYFDNTDPAKTTLTFINVPRFGQPTLRQNFQVRLFAGGTIEFAYGDVDGSGTLSGPLVGISRGNGAVDYGAKDLVTNGVTNSYGPILISSGSNVQHFSNGMRLGQPLSLRAVMTEGSIGLFVIGSTNPQLPLVALGAPGCLLYASADFAYFGSFTGNVLEQELQIPFDPMLAGTQLFSQAAAFAFANPFGMLTSNGIMHRVGL